MAWAIGLLLVLVLAAAAGRTQCSRLEPGENTKTKTIATITASSTARVLVADSGPSPGGNAHPKAASAMDLKSRFVAPSGPNPGGNSEILGGKKVPSMLKSRFVASSGPSPGGNSEILGGKKVAGSPSMLKSRFVAPSGPSPGGNAVEKFVVTATVKPERNESVKLAINLESKMPKATPTPNPGPSKDHNVKPLVSSKMIVLESKLPKDSPTPGSGPNPGHNSVSRIIKVPSPPTSSRVECASDGGELRSLVFSSN